LFLRMLVQLPVIFFLHIRNEKEFIWPTFVIRCMMNYASGVFFSFSCNQTWQTFILHYNIAIFLHA
jgi:hypothetical protein